MSERVVPTQLNCAFSFMNQTKSSFTNKDNCHIYERILLLKASSRTYFFMLQKMKFFKIIGRCLVDRGTS